MLDIRYSKHARLRMVERGISPGEIKNAINKGAKCVQRERILSTYSYFEVVYKKVGNIVYVITVKPRW